MLGRAYFAGEGLPQDYSEAIRWWRKAAGQGNAGAQYMLGRAH
jgi:TPR repeat protein